MRWALGGLLALQLGGEGTRGHEELLDRAVQADLLVGEEVEEARAVVEEILDDDARAVGVAAQEGLVARDDDVEGAGLGRVQEAQEAGALLELGPGDGVVDVDVGGVERPAAGGEVAAGLLELDVQGGDLMLLGAAAGVDGGAHGEELSGSASLRSPA